jgi:hypothetical protein
VRSIQRPYQVLPYKGLAQQLFITKLFQKPLEKLKGRVVEILSGQEDDRNTVLAAAPTEETE